MSNKIDFENLQLNSQSQIQLIEQFLKIANNHYHSHKSLEKYFTTSENLLIDLGIHQKDFKPNVKEILNGLQKYFISLQSANKSMAKAYALPPVSRFLMSPTEYTIQIGSALMESLLRKQILQSRLLSNCNDVQEKNRELTEVKADAKKILLKANEDAEKRTNCLLPENYETLAYTADICQIKLSKLKEVKSFQVKPVNTIQIVDLLEKHKMLKKKNMELSSQLAKISDNNSLPPNMEGSFAIYAERKKYLNTLIHQISSLEESPDHNSSFAISNKDNDSFSVFSG